jgi:UDP-glucuronate decarboxylase
MILLNLIMLRWMKFIIWLVLPHLFITIQSIKTMKTSVMGAINTLGLAKQWMQDPSSSTSEVYGDPSVHPQKVMGNVKPNWVRSCYDEVNVAQKPCLWTHNQNKVAIKIIRIFNTYGLTWILQTVGSFLILLCKLWRGKHHYLWRWIANTLFQYVDDLVEGMIRMMNSDDSF